MRKLKKKEEGGPGPRDSAYMVDNINQILAHGTMNNKILKELTPTEGSLMMQAYLWSKRDDQQGKTPIDVINSFYSRPTDSSNPVDYARQTLAKIGYGPDSMYNASPNVDVAKQKMGGTMKKKDMGGFQPTGPGLAQVATGPTNIPDWASNISQGFIHNSANLPQAQPTQPQYQTQQMKAQSTDSTIGNPINWGHVLQSNLLLGLGQGLANAGPNSQQNAVKRWNAQQFNPMHYLPYTANYSTQDRFGDQSQMKKGGMVKKEDGGYIDADSMRKWIIGEDETPPVVQEAEEQSPQAAQEDDSAQQAAQFNMFIQMFGWDQADQEQEPQGDMKKGGWIKGAVNPKHKGFCSPMTKSTCTPRRKAFAETMKKHHGFHKKALGGSVGEELDVSPEEYQSMIQQGYTFE